MTLGPRRHLDRNQLFGTGHPFLQRENVDDDHGASGGSVQMLPKRIPTGITFIPENIPMLPGARSIIALILLAGSPAFAQTSRYELFPEPDVRQTATNRTASAYVVDKENSQFWICTARYDFRDLTANNGDCLALPADIGRPSLSETYNARPVNGTASISAFLPVIWFIEPTSGAIQFCAVRHAGACVKLTLP
jgi:hypothetical protein